MAEVSNLQQPLAPLPGVIQYGLYERIFLGIVIHHGRNIRKKVTKHDISCKTDIIALRQ